MRQDLSDYLGEVQAMDAGLGCILCELERRGVLDSTLILVLGDHGPAGLPHGKASLYEFGARVAMAARWPDGGVLPGTVVSELV